MAKKPGVKFKMDAFRDIRNNHKVRADIHERAERIAKAAAAMGKGETDGYMVTDLVLEDSRSATSVMATGHAHSHSRKYNSLVRALDAGKG